jgi:hypothetical protein
MDAKEILEKSKDIWAAVHEIGGKLLDKIKGTGYFI